MKELPEQKTALSPLKIALKPLWCHTEYWEFSSFFSSGIERRWITQSPNEGPPNDSIISRGSSGDNEAPVIGSHLPFPSVFFFLFICFSLFLACFKKICCLFLPFLYFICSFTYSVIRIWYICLFSSIMMYIVLFLHQLLF